MLGRHTNLNLANLGQDELKKTAQTLLTTRDTLEDMLPAMKVMANDYAAHISPVVKTASTYWPLIAFVGTLVVAGGAAVGSIVGQNILEKKKRNM